MMRTEYIERAKHSQESYDGVIRRFFMSVIIESNEQSYDLLDPVGTEGRVSS